MRVISLNNAHCKRRYCPLIESAVKLDTLIFGYQYYDGEQFSMQQITSISEAIIRKKKNLKMMKVFEVQNLNKNTIKTLLLTDLTKFVEKIELTTNEIDIKFQRIIVEIMQIQDFEIEK